MVFDFCAIKIVPLKLFFIVNESMNVSTFECWANEWLINEIKVSTNTIFFINKAVDYSYSTLS